MSNTLPIDKRHDQVVKIRLTDKDYEDLRHLAAFLDIPVATLARKLYQQGLRQLLSENNLQEYKQE